MRAQLVEMASRCDRVEYRCAFLLTIAMTLERSYARAGGDPLLIAWVAAELRASWDPAEEFVAPDGERSATSHALAILGMLATGGDTARVKGYLRRAEVTALGEARTTSRGTWQIGWKRSGGGWSMSLYDRYISNGTRQRSLW